MEKYDFCIVGGGPVGIITANRLSTYRKKVVLIELGNKEISKEKYNSKVIINSENFKIHNNILMLGGASNFWEGRVGKMMNIDFKKREWIKNSGWPFQINELDLFYKKAHKLLELINPYEYEEQLSYKYLSKLLDKNFLKILNSKNFFIRGMQYMKKEKRNFNFLINGKFKILLEHEALSFNTKENQITSVNVKNKGQIKKIFSNNFVLACGGIENSRLIMQSKDIKKNFYLGKFFQDHPCGVSASIKLNKKYIKQFKYLDRKVSIKDFVEFNINPDEKFQIINKILNICFELRLSKLSHADTLTIEKYGINSKYKLLQQLKSPFKFLNSIGLKEFLKIVKINLKKLINKIRNIEPYLLIISKVEEVPKLRNKIKLDNGKIKINYKYDELVLDTTRIATKNLLELFELNNLGKGTLVENLDNLKKFNNSFTTGNHPIGSTRISDTPEHGVVDRNLKYHFLDNLHILGSSTFPTGSNTNPTFTSIALALRFVEHMLKKYK